MNKMNPPAILALEDGRVFRGRSWAAEGVVAEFPGLDGALAGLLKPFFPSQGSGGSGFNINLGG